MYMLYIGFDLFSFNVFFRYALFNVCEWERSAMGPHP